MLMRLMSVFGILILVAACETADQGASGVAGLAGPAAGPAPGTVEDFTVNVGNRVFFGYDRYDLSPEARTTLNQQAAWLMQYGSVAVVIEGHADERGTREYNLALGERRAANMRSYLVARGVPAARLQTVSYGKERPEAIGGNEASWSRNRRGVTTLQ